MIICYHGLGIQVTMVLWDSIWDCLIGLKSTWHEVSSFWGPVGVCHHAYECHDKKLGAERPRTKYIATNLNTNPRGGVGKSGQGGGLVKEALE